MDFTGSPKYVTEQLVDALVIVQKLWGFCHTLRHDGVDYGDYIEQWTYLLFLKMAEERSTKNVPKGCDWNSFKDRSGTGPDRSARRHFRAGHAAV